MYEKAAVQGHSEAQLDLGGLFYDGHGVKKDLDKAFEWYNKSANQENSNGQYCVGLCYYYGMGVTKDTSKAKEMMEISAKNGFQMAVDFLKNNTF